MAKDTVVDIQGRKLKLSNLDKVLYPEVGFTKGQVIDYFVRIAPVLLPHLHDRPLTMKRYPNGVSGMFFYEKNCPEHRPEWVQTAPVWSEGNNKWMQYCLAQDLPTLVWAANLADLELHTSLSLARMTSRGPRSSSSISIRALRRTSCNVARSACGCAMRLPACGLKSFAKTSGSKGLQIYVPLNTPVTYDQTKPFAHELARVLERQHPELVVSDMKKALRTNKILVDWSQNDDHKTTICVYSLRAKERPTVSTPVTWEEVEKCLKKGDPNLLVFDSAQVLERVAKQGDLFAPVLKLKQKLPPAEALAKADVSTAQKSTAKSAGSPRSVRPDQGESVEVRATAAKAVKKKQTKTTPQKATSAAKSKAAAGRKRRQA